MTAEGRARAWRWVAIVLLVALCSLGLNSATDDWTHATSMGQRLQVASQFAYGVAGLLAAVALAARWPFARRFFRIFAVCTVLAAGLAPSVWGETPWWTDIPAALGGLLFVWVIWLAFRRGDVVPAAPAASDA